MRNTGPVVRRINAAARRGWLDLGWMRLPCALGRAGTRCRKHEGDGATPIGAWSLGMVLWRADRGRRPVTGLPVCRIRRRDGWCDAPFDRNYNRAVRHPYPASAERLWRDDCLYDVVVVLDYNWRPRIQGRGSAIFVHVARSGLAPTEGCIALAERDLRRLLLRVAPGARLVIGS